MAAKSIRATAGREEEPRPAAMDLTACPDKETCKEDDETDLSLPGFRFHPTDEELVGFYLRRKVEGKQLSVELIKQLDIYKYEPWDLPKASASTGDKEWYFFCMRGRKYRNSIRPNRVTGCGFWKATGIDRPIYSSANGSVAAAATVCVGLKKSLVYYRGSAGKGSKTDWMMHEFRLPYKSSGESSATDTATGQEAETWTLCRIFKRNVSQRKYLQILRDSSTTMMAQQSQQRPAYPPPPDCSSKSCSTVESGVSGHDYSSSHRGRNRLDVPDPSDAPNYDERMPCNNNKRASQVPEPPTSAIETLRDVNWDELDRVMGFPTDHALVYGSSNYEPIA